MIIPVIEALALLIEPVIGSYTIGTPGETEGYTMQYISGALSDTFYNAKEIRTIGLTLHGKNLRQNIVMGELMDVVKALTRPGTYPSGLDWSIHYIQADGPIYVQQEQSTTLWHYVINITVGAYF